MGMKTFKEFIAEAGLARVKDHMDKYDTGMLTAFRDVNTREENKAANRRMLAWLMNKGYGVITVKGAYVMNSGTDEAKEVGETSFLVVDRNNTGKLHDDLKYLGKKFEQESVLLIDKGGVNARLLGTSTISKFLSYGETMKVGQGKFGKASGDFFSRIRGRQFAFEEFSGRGDRWIAAKLAEAVDYDK